jgi:hypothetical protein
MFFICIELYHKFILEYSIIKAKKNNEKLKKIENNFIK